MSQGGPPPGPPPGEHGDRRRDRGEDRADSLRGVIRSIDTDAQTLEISDPDRGGTVRGEGQIPEPDTPPYFGPTQGALLLFKIQTESLSNRPLEVKIVNPVNESETASAELDV